MTATMYAGTIRHRRFAVRSHEFRHRIAFAYLDLDALPVRFGVPEPIASVKLLTMPRSLGVGFNPVSFYYCFDDGGELTHLVAEVTNTPWGERHAYVLPQGKGSPEKAFHVSPFMGMDHEYEVRATAPGETLSVHIASHRAGELAFDATLNLRRRPYRRSRLLGASVRTLLLIYAHAIALKLKGAPYFPHPRPEAS
ncbi:DUF1365 domain-containing protein [Solirubrobacter ginsenosidimutans]|uniref:DUF1365 domain-containing protein n=1 Tax=Solirubrobacter ginsenosidimutans TaxID=490573 RepID=A0A9X3MQ33_9ACTN|nr:DUF1365 domain-containing protein [Solirubrobacter ginsenosidimutans]MDA0159686.1 DUF1365 domain-containing protein [Solirubrobacter ginsenosidimutans]